MNCKEFKKILTENSMWELSVLEIEKIEEHTLSCTDCAAFLQKARGAQEYISHLATASAVIPEDDLFVEEIIDEIISNEKRNNVPSLMELFFQWIQKSRVRFAFAAMLFIIAGIYGYQEYYTVTNLQSLEKHLTESSNANISNASVSTQIISGASWVYDFYKYLNGSGSYWQVTSKTIVISKEKLKKLLTDFNKLSVKEQNELLKLKMELFPELFNKQLLINEEIVINKIDLEKQIKIAKDK